MAKFFWRNRELTSTTDYQTPDKTTNIINAGCHNDSMRSVKFGFKCSQEDAHTILVYVKTQKIFILPFIVCIRLVGH